MRVRLTLSNRNNQPIQGYLDYDLLYISGFVQHGNKIYVDIPAGHERIVEDTPTAIYSGLVLLRPIQIRTNSIAVPIVNMDGTPWPYNSGDPYRVLDMVSVQQQCSANRALFVALVTLIITVLLIASPWLLARPDILFEVDPTPGKISGSTYDAQRRVPQGFLTPVNFTVRLHNIGSAKAINVIVRLEIEGENLGPVSDFMIGQAYLPGLRPYLAPEELANRFTVFILKAGDSGELLFKFGINGTRYLELREKGIPVIIKLTSDYQGRQWYQFWEPSSYINEVRYEVKMPG